MQREVESLGSISIGIRRMRRSCGISQKRLAKMVGLSQSTIARLESDIERLNPSYGTVYKVVEALERLTSEKEDSLLLNKVSSDIMHKNVVHVRPTDTIEKAIRIIKNYDFPQIPVLNNRKNVIGTVSQKKLLAIATESPDSISRMHVAEIIDASLPQVDKNTDVTRLKPILENFNAVIVVDGSKAVGIITIYDVLKLL